MLRERKNIKHIVDNTKNKADKRKNRKIWGIYIISAIILIGSISILEITAHVPIANLTNNSPAVKTTPILRGVNWAGLSYRCPHGITLQKLTDIKNQWNINILRIDFNERDYTNDAQIWNGGTWVSYPQTMRNIVNWSNNLGITVILDLHWLSSDQSTDPEIPIPDISSVTMWGQLSQEPLYNNNSLVWFDIWNEPHTGTNITFSDWRSRANDIVTEIRKYANNTVLVGGMDYATDLSPWRGNYLTQSNVVYNSHPYSPSVKGPSAYDLDGHIGGVLSDGKAVYLDEFGANWSLSGDRDWLTNYALPWFDGVGRGPGIHTTPLGWAAWSMNDEPLLTDSKPGCYDSSITPSDYGKVIQNKLKENLELKENLRRYFYSIFR